MSENKELFVTYEMFGAKGDGVTQTSIRSTSRPIPLLLTT